jgi:hypothetical protein
MSNDKQPSFAARRAVLEQAARDLVTISDIVHDEVERMAAAEKRFTERRGQAKRRA